MTTRPDPPNYTQIPNIILGNIKPGNIVDPGLMEKLKGSELKVLLAVYRLTFGFHQEERRASLQLIQDMTGMSKQSVLNAAKSLEETHGLIERKKDGGVTLWKAMVNFLDNTECQAMVQKLDPDVQKLDKVVQKLDIHLRKKPKKKPKKKDSGADAPPKRPATIPSFQVYVEETDCYALNKQQRHIIQKTVGTDPAKLEQWREVVKTWVLCGYKPINANGMIDWFVNGIPDNRKRGNGASNGPSRQVATETSQSSETAERAQWLTEKFKQAGRGSA